MASARGGRKSLTSAMWSSSILLLAAFVLIIFVSVNESKILESEAENNFDLETSESVKHLTFAEAPEDFKGQESEEEEEVEKADTGKLARAAAAFKPEYLKPKAKSPSLRVVFPTDAPRITFTTDPKTVEDEIEGVKEDITEASSKGRDVLEASPSIFNTLGSLLRFRTKGSKKEDAPSHFRLPRYNAQGTPIYVKPIKPTKENNFNFAKRGGSYSYGGVYPNSLPSHVKEQFDYNYGSDYGSQVRGRRPAGQDQFPDYEEESRNRGRPGQSGPENYPVYDEYGEPQRGGGPHHQGGDYNNAPPRGPPNQDILNYDDDPDYNPGGFGGSIRKPPSHYDYEYTTFDDGPRRPGGKFNDYDYSPFDGEERGAGREPSYDYGYNSDGDPFDDSHERSPVGYKHDGEGEGSPVGYREDVESGGESPVGYREELGGGDSPVGFDHSFGDSAVGYDHSGGLGSGFDHSFGFI